MVSFLVPGLSGAGESLELTQFPSGMSFLKISGRLVRTEKKGSSESASFLRIVGETQKKAWVEDLTLESAQDQKVWVSRKLGKWIDDDFNGEYGFHLSVTEIPPPGEYWLTIKTANDRVRQKIVLPQLAPTQAPQVEFLSKQGKPSQEFWRVLRFDDSQVPGPAEITDRKFVIGFLEPGEGWGGEEPLYTELMDPEALKREQGYRLVDVTQLPKRKEPLKLVPKRADVFHLTVQERTKRGVIQFIRERAVMKELLPVAD